MMRWFKSSRPYQLIMEFEKYIDENLEGAECSCSPKGLPHSENCKGWFPGQDSFESLRDAGKAAVESALAQHDEFLKQERENEEFWNRFVRQVVGMYEQETGTKWVPGSEEVTTWANKLFKK